MSEISGLPPSNTSPEKAIPHPPPTPLPIPSLQTLRSWLPLYISKTDHTIDRLSKILSTPSGTDTFLCTLCYSSLLTSTVLSSISLHRIHSAALQLIEKAISLPPNTTVIIDTSSIPSSKLLITAQRLKALSSLISDFRIFARLWGLLGIWKWGKRVLENPPEDSVLRSVSYAQVVVNIAYQYLENYAYLSSKGVLGWSTEKQNRAYIWSSRFWMAHVGLDFVRLYHENAVRGRNKKGKGKEGVEDLEESAWRAKWRKQLVVNSAWAPLTLHWGLEQGLVGDIWIGVLGSVAGIANLRELWKNTEKP
jgi:hypothetical protein